MNEYRHPASGFFARCADAESALSELVERGLLCERLDLLASDSGLPSPAPQEDGKEVLQKDVRTA